MLQLVNLSNASEDVALIHNSGDYLQTFLMQHHLDGLEMMLCRSWNERLHRKEWLYGVHLPFWPCWLDFWRGDQKELLRQFGSEQQIKAYYGCLTREAWLNGFRDIIRTAKQAGAQYLVFHVSHARVSEVFNWRFSATDREVVQATLEVINELAADIPESMALLFENLWWPGLTLKDKKLTAMLLDEVKHRNIGIMLDTGHLMNTNPELQSEAEGIHYILEKVADLGTYRQYIRGVHLHRSLSGPYIKQSQAKAKQEYSPIAVMNHVLKIDEHLPFTTPEVQHLIESIQPDYLVHEFMVASMADWAQKVTQQQQALQL